MTLAPEAIRDVARRALEEDRAFEDITTLAIVPEDARGSAHLIAKQACVIAGLDVFEACFRQLDPSIRVKHIVRDGEEARVGGGVATVEGSLRAILSAERSALNFIQRLSGIATMTRAFVEAVKAARPDEDTPLVKVKDTRKTTPLLRDLEKAAVVAGGGSNHRRDLASALLIKDNHIAAAGGLTAAVHTAYDNGGQGTKAIRWVEVECENLEQVQEALATGAQELLLDNMDVETLSKAVALCKEAGRQTEASGGVTLATVGAIARTGVDSISVGALTHSAPAIDLSLEVEAS